MIQMRDDGGSDQGWGSQGRRCAAGGAVWQVLSPLEGQQGWRLGFSELRCIWKVGGGAQGGRRSLRGWKLMEPGRWGGL